jgi:putative ABC transport system permease protein
MSFLAVLLGLFVVAYLATAAVVLRRPLIGRIAVREAGRRPGQTAVLVIGLMIAGAAIFSIQVILDSVYETSRAQVLQSWGRDDVEISGGGSTFDAALAQRLASQSQSQSCSCIAAYQNAVVTNGSVVDVTREAGRPNVQITGLDLAAEQPFGAFVLANGHATLGDELATGGVFLSQPLADALSAQSGDHLRVIAGGAGSHDVTVAGIVRRDGAGAYGFALSMFASLPTVQQLTGADGINLIRISARGDGDAEVANGQTAASVLRGLLAVQGSSLQVLEGKRGALAIVNGRFQAGGPFITFFGVIIALAATALVASLAVMLSEERRPRLAILRALGLTRTGLVQLSITEGAIYSLLGAIAGLPTGLALAFVVIRAGVSLGTAVPNTTLSVHAGSLFGSVAAAALINLVTVFLASLRTSRMTISSAIRDLPEPSIPKRTSWTRLAFLAALAFAGVILVLSGHPEYALLGGALVIASAAGLIRGRISDRVRISAASAGAAAWAFIDFQFTKNPVDTPIVFAFAVLVSVIALSVLIAANFSVLDWAIGLVGHVWAGLRATLRPAMAYSSRRPLRTGLLITTFAIVVAFLTLVQNLISTPSHNSGLNSGGWDVQAIVTGTDQLSVPDSLQSEVAKQEEFPSRTFLGPVNWEYSGLVTTGWHQEPVMVFGLSQLQLESGMGFGNPADWAAIAQNPNLVASAAPAGSVVYLATDHGTVTFRVVVSIPSASGTGPSSVVPGLLASRQSLDMLGGSAPGAMMLLTPAPGISAGALARDLQRATLSEGVDVSTTESLLDQDYAANSGLPNFLTLLMRIGLLVGISSLGAVALRAVIERRRSIGVLRAIGYQPGQVLTGMLTETAVVATAGLAVGSTVGYALTYATLSTGPSAPGARFSPDLSSLALTIALVFAAVLLATLLPALRAARLRPAEALRVVG